jgi:glutamate racemase
MIGIFDSGVGGLSVFRELKKLFPDRGIIYLADKKNFPYGEKSQKKLKEICENNINLLLQNGAKIIIIACNSATVSTISELRKIFDVPIIGIEPAIKVAADITKTGKIGLIATKMTVANHQGEKYLKNGQKVFKTDQHQLVSMIENHYEKISQKILKDSVAELVSEDVDCIALGCTHFHFIRQELEKIYPQYNFIAPDIAVAKRAAEVIKEKSIEIPLKKDIFLVTKDVDSFRKNLKLLLGIEAGVRRI